MKFTKMKPFKLFMEFHNSHISPSVLVNTIEKGVKEIDKKGSVNVSFKTSIPTIAIKSPIPESINS